MENRPYNRLKAHYDVEKALADQLRNAPRALRIKLYPKLYNKLFTKVWDHPQLTKKQDKRATKKDVLRRLRLINRFIKKDHVFMEIGSGDNSLTKQLAKLAKHVYAIEASKEITKNADLPKNIDLLIVNSNTIPVPKGSINVAYSYQLMEHLHPEDAIEQLTSIYKSLKSGGAYICITPNALSGPHDISQYFTKKPTGFHLKEYTIIELEQVFKKVGFSQILSYAGGKGIYVRMPLGIAKGIEHILQALPFRLQKLLARHLPIKAFLGIILVGVK